MHEHVFVPTKYDAYELRCEDPDCYVIKIIVGNPRYCPLMLARIPHEPHEHTYEYYRYQETTPTTGQVWCNG